MKKIIYPLLGLSFILMLFSLITLFQSLVFDKPFFNQSADNLRGILGNDAVKWLEERLDNTRDMVSSIRNNEEVTVDFNALEKFDKETSLQKDSQKETPESSVKETAFHGLFDNGAKDKASPEKEETKILISKHLLNTKEELPVTPSYKEVPYSADATLSHLESLISKPVLEGEGLWKALDTEGIFYHTRFRPDVKRNYAVLDLCAIDLSKANLHFVFGSQYRDMNKKYHPGTIKDEHKEGALAAFNGGFQPIHDSGGFVIDGKELISLKENKGTLIIYGNGDVDIINVTAENIEEIRILLKHGVIQYIRQNLPILLEDKSFNESNRFWGYVLQGKDPVYAFRSGLGITDNKRYIIFAAGDYISPKHLAQGLSYAGSVNAMHLDMNISNIGFNLYSTKDGKKVATSLSNSFRYLVGRYLRGYGHDFFYVLKKGAAEATLTTEKIK